MPLFLVPLMESMNIAMEMEKAQMLCYSLGRRVEYRLLQSTAAVVESQHVCLVVG